jgi:hypothetical protein
LSNLPEPNTALADTCPDHWGFVLLLFDVEDSIRMEVTLYLSPDN